MQRRTRRAGPVPFVLLLSLGALASCTPVGEAASSDAAVEAEIREEAAVRLAASSAAQQPRYHLVPCEAQRRADRPVRIGEEGGTVEIGGHRLDIPPGAVVGDPVRFQMQIAGGVQDRRVRIRADGQPSYRFAVPVVLTLSTEGCERPDSGEPFAIVKVIPTEEGDVVETPDFPSVDDRLNGVVHAQLRTLSGYSVGIR